VTVVVDASVAVKWSLDEPYSPEARRLLAPEWVLVAPDLLFAEVGSALWKRIRRGELTVDEARAVLIGLDRMALEVHPGRPLAAAAVEIASRLGRTVYDALYLALAVARRCRVVTADRRFYGAVSSTSLGSRVRWVEDIE
jgi:predicted nucleic acid-binding protein